ncbi:MAG: Bacterial rane protein YfhO [Gammaproteobacteria bacterium]|nr:Bacterial rane protein YfhO [Gammaproteobacteria bacterium]
MKLLDYASLKIKQKILFNLFSLFLIFFIIQLFPFEPLRSFEMAEEGVNCPYYFTLQSLLARYPLLAADKANAKFIKQKLQKFENKMTNPFLPFTVVNHYKNPYFNNLAKLNLRSINFSNSDDEIIRAASKTAPIVDGFYLDKNINCISPLYNWGNPTRRVLRFNLNGLYDQLPNKYSQIMMASPPLWITGASPGYFILNQTETFDTRYMTGLPMLTALYVLPKNDFTNYGSFESPATWLYFNIDSLRDPIIRKMLNIGGIDIFTILTKDLKDKKIPNVFMLPTKINPLFGKNFKSFVNEESYGLVYFANNITYENSDDIESQERYIKHYFSHHDDVVDFRKKINILYHKLMQLKYKDDVILEFPKIFSNLDNSTRNQKKGEVSIHGIIAERAFFTTNCLQKNCLFVFNIGKAPGWHAFVNNTESNIMRANFAFMATEVPQGIATVWFIYAPTSKLISYFVSIFTLLIIFLMTGFKKSEIKI